MPETIAGSGLHETTRRTLLAEPKELPAVWLYDERGSLLYEEITQLPDYYLPRREAEILRAHAPEIAGRTRAVTLVELGSGNAANTRYLLDAIGTLERFAPIDVSEEMLRATARAVAAAYPQIAVDEVVGDFRQGLDGLAVPGPRLVALLGSTIGNLYPGQRAGLFTTLAGELDPDDALVLGIDLVKDVARLEAAYDDPAGVTEAFVRNALTAVNRELAATFDQRRFAYEASWDPAHEWMDIGLRAGEAHTVAVPRLGLELAFGEGERLRVEVSAKFRRGTFEPELEQGGFRVEAWMTDGAGDFAVVLARVDG